MRKAERRPEVKPPLRWQFREPERFWLDNGMQLLLAHREGQHIASVALLLDIPLSLEPAGRHGVATITQRCVDEGTATHPGTAFSEALEDIGAELSGAAGFSATEFYLDVPVAHLAEGLELLAEAVREPTLEASDVRRHQQLRLAEIEQAESNSAHRANLSFRAACIQRRFRAAEAPGGDREQVGAIEPSDVAEFHARHYRPEGATLIISGAFGRDLSALVAATFGDWLPDPGPAFLHQVPEPRRPHLWLVDRPGSVQADLRLGGFGIDRSDPRWADIQVGTYALGGAFLSRLNKVLREEKGFTYGVHLVNTPLRDGGLIAVQGSFRTEVLPEALELARHQLDVVSAPITNAEVQDAVSFTNGVAPLRYSTAQAVTERIAQLTAAGVSVDFINANAYAITQVTPESATAALTELLPPDQLSLVVVGDADRLHQPLVEAGWPVSIKS